MMIMSFFQTVDALPYVQSADLIVNGNEIVLTEDEQAQLQQQVVQLFEGSHTMPAFGVMFDDMYHEAIQKGTYVSLKFGRVFEVNELPFDELVFQVSPDWSGFNLFRGMNGIFQGRCIYIDLNGKTMQEFSDFINSLPAVQEAMTETPQIEETPVKETPQEQISVEEVAEKQTSNTEVPVEELPEAQESEQEESSQIQE